METYTMKDLKRNSKAYSKMFDKLINCKLNSHEHNRLVKEEKRLYNKEVKIRKALGIFIPNLCKLDTVVPCRDCTGFYKTVTSIQPKNTVKLIVQAKGGKKCNLKDIMGPVKIPDCLRSEDRLN